MIFEDVFGKQERFPAFRGKPRKSGGSPRKFRRKPRKSRGSLHKFRGSFRKFRGQQRSRNWYPRSRDGQIHLVDTWLQMFQTKASAWNIPPANGISLTAADTNAKNILAVVKSGERGCRIKRFWDRNSFPLNDWGRPFEL
jgi:hypothetical protein